MRAADPQRRRQELADWFRATLAELDFDRWLPEAMKQNPRPLGPKQLVIAFGKAARPMAATVMREFPGHGMRGLLVPPEPDASPLPQFEVIPGGHPLPSAGSMAAAAAALELCAGATEDEELLFLVSGGGSALLELPLDAATTLDELRTFYRALVGCGGTIDEINTIRKHCSLVKGGKLAAAARRARFQRTLAISDVPCDRLETIASGPTVADPSSATDCAALIERLGISAAVPALVRARLADGRTPPNLAADDPVTTRSWLIAVINNMTAMTALRDRVAAAGLQVEIDQETDDLPWQQAAAQLLRRLRALKAGHPDQRVAIVAGGELSVPLPANPGAGGRNQQFALACALRIAGQPIAVLSCGTDGIDGNSPAAGATADGTTVARARAIDIDADHHLQQFDAFSLFDALDDAVLTGPTGTNVRDLRLLVHD